MSRRFDPLIRALGANAELHPRVRDYMFIILCAAPLLIVGFTLAIRKISRRKKGL